MAPVAGMFRRVFRGNWPKKTGRGKGVSVIHVSCQDFHG